MSITSRHKACLSHDCTSQGLYFIRVAFWAATLLSFIGVKAVHAQTYLQSVGVPPFTTALPCCRISVRPRYPLRLYSSRRLRSSSVRWSHLR
jgi:hypothetical protein